MRFLIGNMNCGGCAGSVTAAIRAVDPAATVRTDVAGRAVEIGSQHPRADFAAALKEAGYPAQGE